MATNKPNWYDPKYENDKSECEYYILRELRCGAFGKLEECLLLQ